jgi:hypothetical protein
VDLGDPLFAEGGDDYAFVVADVDVFVELGGDDVDERLGEVGVEAAVEFFRGYCSPLLSKPFSRQKAKTLHYIRSSTYFLSYYNRPPASTGPEIRDRPTGA